MAQIGQKREYSCIDHRAESGEWQENDLVFTGVQVHRSQHYKAVFSSQHNEEHMLIRN